jgi:hypothetical protein
MTPTTFAELNGVALSKDRCARCGNLLLKADRVTVTVQAARNHGRKTPEWLFRRSVGLCESCAVRVVTAACDSVASGNRTWSDA